MRDVSFFLTMVPPDNTEARRIATSAFRARSMESLDDLGTGGVLRPALSAKANG